MSYNIGAKYEIVGRVMSGRIVEYYIIKDRVKGSLSPVEKGITEQLALNKQIYNCTGQVYNNIINLRGINCRLSTLPKYTKDCKIEAPKERKPVISANLKLIGKVQNGREIQEYVVICIDDPTTKMKIPRDVVIKLAHEGRLLNAKSQMNGESLMLRGTEDFNLTSLEVYS